MPNRAKAYLAAIILIGCSLSAFVLMGWRSDSQELTRLFIYMLAAVLTSGFKVWLPGNQSTISMNYVIVIAGVLDLDGTGSLLVGAAGVLGQTFYKNQQAVRWNQVLFNLSTNVLSVVAAGYFYHLHLFSRLDPVGLCSVVLASLAYFSINTLLLSGIIGLTTAQKGLAVWRESYLWTSPQYLVGGLVATGIHVTIYRIGWAGMIATLPVMYLVYRSYKLYLSRVDEQQHHLSEMAQLHLRTIEALALAIDAKDDTTAAHLRRVQVYASEIGKDLGLSKLDMQALGAAALLHDIGKLAVPEYIISKPGKLTKDEFEKMKVHPVVGAEILERVNFPYPVAPIVRSHHEKYDGSGYPDGLKGEEIPIGARILSVVDCMDALASDRQYRQAMPIDKAMDIIVQEAGRSYDPQVVKILKERYRELEAKAKVDAVEPVKWSSNIKVERGASPATGFAPDLVSTASDATSSKDFRMQISDARREFQMLVEMANDLGNSLSLRDTLALLAVRLEERIPHDAVAIYVREGDTLVPRFVKGESSRLFSMLRIPVGHGLSGWVAENNLPIVNGNPAVESGYLNDPTKVTLLRSAIAVPLRYRDRVVGVLTLYQLKTDAFTLEHKRILLNISDKAGTVIENALRFEQVRNEARLDELTGLLNPRSLFEELDQALALCCKQSGSVAVVAMDLDGFKMTNDEHGHILGDRVLQCLATRLKKACRTRDLVGRWGGDEFVLLLPDPGDSIGTLRDRLAEVGEAARAEIGCRTPITISVGYAIYPRDAIDAEGLLEKADERMYEEKRRRKSLSDPLPKNLLVFPSVVRKQNDVSKSNQQNEASR